MTRQGEVLLLDKDAVSLEQWVSLKNAYEGGNNIQVQGRWWVIKSINKRVVAGGVVMSAKLLEVNGPH